MGEKASNAVRRATDELVKAAQGAIDRNEEENEMTMNTTAGSVNIIAEEVEARETVQSGYESSGYEYTSASSPQTYTSYRQVYTSPPQQQQHTSQHSSLFQSNQSYSEPDTSANPDSTIESGPSFSESLNRFKTASGHNAQVASWKSSRQQSSTSSHVQRRVEETRTMITQSSQKSYHIE